MRSSAVVLRALQRLAAAPVAAQQQASAACLSAVASSSSARSFGDAWAGSRSFAAQPLPVDGDLAGLLREIDAAVSSDAASAKDVADAAMGLAYLQARADRRLWGKVFERAGALKAGFDAASLTAFLWAASAANVTHFKTLFELSGPAARLLPTLSPAQLATVVASLGKAGVSDAELFRAVSDRVAAKPGDFTAAQLSQLLWGAAAGGAPAGALAKAAAGALAGKAGEAGAKDLAQAAWALGKLGRADKPALDAISRALGSKLGAGGGDGPADAAAALWAFAQLNYKPDASALSKASAAVKAGAADLTTEQAIDAAWALALLGGDKDALAPLLSAAGAAVAAAPDCVPVGALAMLAEAQALASDRLGASAPKLPDQVFAYAQGMHALASDARRARRGASEAAFFAAVGEAAARAGGARYKPELAAAVAKLPRKTSDGLAVEMGLDLDGDLKVAVLALTPSELSSGGDGAGAAHLGPAEAARRLLEKRGYKVAVVAQPAFEAAKDDKARAAVVLAAVKAAAPGSGKVAQLEKQLAAAFDPYAE